MITNATDYYSLLYKIQNANRQDEIIPLPVEEPIYDINLNTRQIKGPASLGVKEDHLAEIIYFCVDRYYDYIDLYNTTCVIQYINADGEGKVYHVPYYDIKTMGQDKIIFPWVIGHDVTKAAGKIKYNIQFYEINKNTRLFDYNIQTQPTSSEVLYTFSIRYEEDYEFSPTEIEKVWYEIDNLKKDWDLYWIDLT